MIKRMLALACVYFTVIVMCYMAVLAFLNIGEEAIAVQGYRVILYLVAGVLLAFANLVRQLNIKNVLKVIFHYLICLFTFFACFILPMNMRASHVIVGITLFTLLYTVIRLIVFLFFTKLKKNRERPSEYQSQFSKKK